MFDSSLEEIIASKLSGSIAKAITAWCLPLYEAYAFLIKENAKNTSVVSFLVASLAKSEVSLVDSAMRSRSLKSLKEVVTGSLSGNR